jgi:hypothetical protein
MRLIAPPEVAVSIQQLVDDPEYPENQDLGDFMCDAIVRRLKSLRDTIRGLCVRAGVEDYLQRTVAMASPTGDLRGDAGPPSGPCHHRPIGSASVGECGPEGATYRHLHGWGTR